MVTHNPELAAQYATRIVNLKDGVIEISARDKSFSEKLAPADVADRVQQKIAEMMQFDVD